MMRSPVKVTNVTMFFVLILMAGFCSATKLAKDNKPPDTKPVQSCPSCNNGGQTGMWTYMTCVPGTPGAPGRDGAKGDLGSAGKPGTQGPRGADGKKGAKGEPGTQGSTGQKGQRGDKDDSGTAASYTNWKECTWASSKSVRGRIYSCDFVKKNANSVLHVYFAGNLKVYDCSGCCSRWYFTFNGAECSSPGSIDGIFYIGTPSNVNHNFHNHHHIEGHCKNIQKGKVRVGFWVGKCGGSYKLGNTLTGFDNAVNRIFMEEVPRAQQ